MPADREPALGGPALFAGAVGLAVALAALAPAVRLDPAWRLVGLLPLTAGVTLHWTAWRLFRRRGVEVADHRVPDTLVTSGPYRWSRNPMLLAGVLILLGGGLLLRAASALAVAPLYGWLCRRLFVLPEERILSERFGAEYEAYADRVRRWL